MNLGQNKLVIQNIPYSEKGLKSLERISPANRQVILDRNTVYIVNEQSGKQYKVYVGETNNIQKRTLQHLKDKDDVLQQIKDGYLYVIGDSECSYARFTDRFFSAL
ncbi:GIY-YIG nuclease family protein [Weissella confusa]|uniref:GIY-YIG nuclease family protein n=1 Tax=Weissella confusa TaxID=1583 RepID=A0AAJ2Z0U9_WEICO|nr:GIY-YIG nuclease family protein [Weissella confusa]NBA12503.1 GIY-YIG nuclease family protein [Weissella confusa]